MNNEGASLKFGDHELVKEHPFAIRQEGMEHGLAGMLLKPLTIFAIAWELAVVVFGMAYAPPFKGLNDSVGLSDSLMRLFYPYESMFFHALAVPFVAVLAYTTLAILEVKGRIADVVTVAVTLGFLLASASALSVMFWGYSSLAMGGLWTGLSLCLLGALGLMMAVWPRKETGGTALIRGRGLARMVIFAAIGCLLAAVSVGAFASTGSTQWGAPSSFDGFRLVVASHTHVVITIIDAALVALIARHFGADTYEGIPGLFVRIGLYGLLLGVPTTTVATIATVPMGVAAHNAITIFAGILLQASLFVMYAIVAVEFRKLGSAAVSGVLKKALPFGMLFTIFWVNVVVTLPGIYVAINLKRFVGLPNEVAFITGHEHVLIALTAMTLLMLISLVYQVKGRLGTFAGGALTAGYIVSTGATVPYMFLDWDPVSSVYIPYMGAGIMAMVVGVFAATVGLLVTREPVLASLKPTTTKRLGEGLEAQPREVDIEGS
jgi:hypothetical protein